MPDLDSLLRSDIASAAAEAVPPRDFAPIERRGAQRRRTRSLLTAAAAAVVVALVGLGSTWFLAGRQDTSLTPVEPQPSATPTPDWTGPLRPGVSLPWLSLEKGATEVGTGRGDVRSDGPDTALGGIDIRRVEAGGWRRLQWTLELRAAPPSLSALEEARRVIEYGVVVDADGDRVADCHIGINNDSPGPGDYRVWVKNLRTGVSDVQLGPSYGYAIDFSHPGEARADDQPKAASAMRFFFLSDMRPCDAFRASASFYAYASVQDDGHVTEWDYAPDAAWLRMPRCTGPGGPRCPTDGSR